MTNSKIRTAVAAWLCVRSLLSPCHERTLFFECQLQRVPNDAPLVFTDSRMPEGEMLLHLTLYAGRMRGSGSRETGEAVAVSHVEGHNDGVGKPRKQQGITLV